MVNVNKLKGKIVENGLSVKDLAIKIGVDKATLYRKLSFSESFSIKEADAIVKELNLTKEEAVAIFFNQFVA